MKPNAAVILAIIVPIAAIMLFAAFTIEQPTPVTAPAPTQQLPRLLMAEQPDFAPVVHAQPALGEVYEGEPGVVYWSDVPRDWNVCVDEAKVYGGPAENEAWYLKSLPKDTPVMVRELDSSRTFAAIGVAEYVKFTDLCR